MSVLPDLTNIVFILESQLYCQASEELRFGPLNYMMRLFFIILKKVIEQDLNKKHHVQLYTFNFSNSTMASVF